MPHLLEQRRDALRREQARVDDVAERHVRPVQRTQQREAVERVPDVVRPAELEALAEGGRVEGGSAGRLDAVRDDEDVRRVAETRVREAVKRVRRRRPDEPVERRPLSLRIDEEDGVGRDGGQVDRSAERDGYARVDVEAVQRVEHVDVRAVGRVRRAVGLRQRDAQPGELRQVDLRVEVRREGLARLDACERERRQRKQQDTGDERGAEQLRHGCLPPSALTPATLFLSPRAAQRSRRHPVGMVSARRTLP